MSVAAPPRPATEQPEPTPERSAPGLTDPPQWITPAEASFLAAVDEARIRSWIDAGLLETVSMFRRHHDPNLVLVNARDLAWARDREDQPEAVGSPAIAVPTISGRSRTRRYVEVGLTIALLLVWLNAIRPTFTAEPISGDRAGLPASPLPAGAGTTVPSDLVPSTILIRWTGFVRDGDRIDLAATVANPDPERWIPPGDAAFVLQDASGAVLTVPVSLSIGPGGTRTVMVKGADLGDVSVRSIASIHLISLVPPQPAAQYGAPSIKLSHVRLKRTRQGNWAVGRVTNDGSSGGSASIQCALIDGSGNLLAVETAEPIRARAGHTTPFAVRLHHAPAHDGRVACSNAT